MIHLTKRYSGPLGSKTVYQPTPSSLTLFSFSTFPPWPFQSFRSHVHSFKSHSPDMPQSRPMKLGAGTMKPPKLFPQPSEDLMFLKKHPSCFKPLHPSRYAHTTFTHPPPDYFTPPPTTHDFGSPKRGYRPNTPHSPPQQVSNRDPVPSHYRSHRRHTKIVDFASDDDKPSSHSPLNLPSTSSLCSSTYELFLNVTIPRKKEPRTSLQPNKTSSLASGSGGGLKKVLKSEEDKAQNCSGKKGEECTKRSDPVTPLRGLPSTVVAPRYRYVESRPTVESKSLEKEGVKEVSKGDETELKGPSEGTSLAVCSGSREKDTREVEYVLDPPGLCEGMMEKSGSVGSLRESKKFSRELCSLYEDLIDSGASKFLLQERNKRHRDMKRLPGESSVKHVAKHWVPCKKRLNAHVCPSAPSCSGKREMGSDVDKKKRAEEKHRNKTRKKKKTLGEEKVCRGKVHWGPRQEGFRNEAGGREDKKNGWKRKNKSQGEQASRASSPGLRPPVARLCGDASQVQRPGVAWSLSAVEEVWCGEVGGVRHASVSGGLRHDSPLGRPMEALRCPSPPPTELDIAPPAKDPERSPKGVSPVLLIDTCFLMHRCLTSPMMDAFAA